VGVDTASLWPPFTVARATIPSPTALLSRVPFSYSLHRRFIYNRDTSTHAEGTDLTGGLSEEERVRRHYAPLCSTLVAAKSGSICIAVVLVSVSGGVIVLSGERLVGEVAAGEGGRAGRSSIE